MMNLDTKAWLSLAVLAIVLGLLLFIPAGTVRYWQAWVFLLIFIGTSILITLYLMTYDPGLLERRMRGGPLAERQLAQKFIMWCMSLEFIALIVVPALDFRFGWSAVPPAVVVVGDGLVAAGFYFIFLVYRENPFSSATIEIAKDQRVIATGPYSVIRHPMYASASLYLLGTPLALGSYWGIAVFCTMVPFLLWRLLDEERFLVKNLPGYSEYQKRVRYRIVPLIW